MSPVPSSARLGNPPPRRVAIFRALQLGDLLCSVPAFRALRRALPDAEIVLIGLPWAREFVARYRHYFDGFRDFPGYPGLPEQEPRIDKLPGFLAALREERFNLIVQMQGDGTITNPLTATFGGAHHAGYHRPGQFCPDPERFLPYPQDRHEVRRHLRLMDFLGIPPRGESIDFPVCEADRAALREALGELALQPGSYACLHPGARAPSRRWPAEHFATVADHLSGRGLRIVLTGTREEASLTRRVAGAMRAPALDLAGHTSLGAAAALLQDARLLVCNNTGVSHLAAALRTPSVALLHEPAELCRWAPLDARRHRAIFGDTWPEPDAVLAAVAELLHDPTLATEAVP
jgi:ADP-heptose:LPS heptosyltransferase